MTVLLALVAALLLSANGAAAGGGPDAPPEGDRERDPVARLLVADARPTTRAPSRAAPRRPAPALRPVSSARDARHLVPGCAAGARGAGPFAMPRRRDAATRAISRWQPIGSGARQRERIRDALRTIAEVAPSDRDRRHLNRLLRAVPGPRPRATSDEPTATPRLVDPATRHGIVEPTEREHPSQRLRGLERFVRRFADELVSANESHLMRIRLETRLLRIHGTRGFATDRDNLHSARSFFQAYLQRRGPRAVYSAAFKTAGTTPFVARTSRTVMRFRDRYLNLTHTYGNYERESIDDQTDASVADWAERNESQLTLPDETIEEELERRRLAVDDTSFNPFRRGRVTVRASTTDWVEAVWKTPNLELKLAPKKSRIRMGVQMLGLDFASYASTRYRGWRGRSGVEVVRRLDESSHIRLSAGVNYGRRDNDERAPLVDFFSLTDDAQFAYLAWERRF